MPTPVLLLGWSFAQRNLLSTCGSQIPLQSFLREPRVGGLPHATALGFGPSSKILGGRLAVPAPQSLRGLPPDLLRPATSPRKSLMKHQWREYRPVRAPPVSSWWALIAIVAIVGSGDGDVVSLWVLAKRVSSCQPRCCRMLPRTSRAGVDRGWGG